MKLKDCSEIVEINSCYVKEELHRKFVQFIEYYDSLGLKIDDVEIDLNSHSSEFQEDESIEDIALAMSNEDIKDIPEYWALINDDANNPIFKPIISDGSTTDFDKAMNEYGLDIIHLKTAISDIVKTIIIRTNNEVYEFIGTLRQIQEQIVAKFEFKEVRKQIYEKIKEDFLEETIHSFMLKIPAHSKSIVIGIKN